MFRFQFSINVFLENDSNSLLMKSNVKDSKRKEKYPGSWLFQKLHIKWMFRPVMNRQLPLLLKIYSWYAAIYFNFSGGVYLLGGRKLFLMISCIHRLSGFTHKIFNVDGTKICMLLTDPRFLCVVSEMQSNSPIKQLLGKFLHEGDTFIDIGANHGSFSVIAGNMIGKKGLLISVEPNPELARAINITLRNSAKCNYEVYQVALGNQSGVVKFLIPNDTSGAAGLFESHSGIHGHRRVFVPFHKFDDLVDWDSFTGNIFIKIDIEGSEFMFLQGAAKMIKAKKAVLLMEINPQTLHISSTGKKQLIKLMSNLGYKYFAFSSNPSLIKTIEALETDVFSNLLFFIK